MARVLKFLAALAGAVVVHALAQHLWSDAVRFFDPFLVLAIYAALGGRPASATFAGLSAGWVTDALSGGRFGLYGFADTLTAFLAARLRQRLVVQHPLQVALLYALAAAIQQGLVALLAFLLITGGELAAPVEIAGKMLSTALCGLALGLVVRRFGRGVESWRESRSRRIKIAR